MTRNIFSSDQTRFAVYSDCEFTSRILDVFKESKGHNIEVSSRGLDMVNTEPLSQGSSLDITTWLPFAAKKYVLSGDIRDYIFVPIVTITADVPNRNGIAFPLKELVTFDTEAGMQAYKTFKGKPIFIEHANRDIT